MDSLRDYMDRTESLPWVWGAQDCTMWVADWCLIRWGIDPAANYRGRYCTENEALRLTSCGLETSTQGLLDLVDPEIRMPQKGVPSVGDIGVIQFRGNQLSAIWTGFHWAFRTPRGIAEVRATALKVWGF